MPDKVSYFLHLTLHLLLFLTLFLAFCCVAALSIVNALHLVDQDLLGWWLSERQVTNGGLNGRPEKLADVCTSVYSSSFFRNV